MLRMLKAMDANLGKQGSLVTGNGEAVSENDAAGDARLAQAAAEPMNEETAAVNQLIHQVNATAAVAGYRDYREPSPLHSEGQRVLNMYYEKPLDR